MNTINRIAALLKQTMGLDANSIGIQQIERAIAERMTALRLDNQTSYLLTLQETSDEMQALIEQVVIPETYFFRDREAMSAMTVLAQRQLQREPYRPLRILSLPCSTGEEPYSLAMELLDAGIAADRFRIDAIDISQRALAVAQDALYGSNSFRGRQLDYRDRHFHASGTQYLLSERIRRQVFFRLGNLFADDFLCNEAPYDYVFCRNVLIYFDRPMQDQAVAILQRLLAPQGTLFIGPAESGILMRQQLASIGMPLAFGFRHRDIAPVAQAATKPAIRRPLPSVVPRIPPKPTAPVRILTQAVPAAHLPEPAELMQQALACADRGDLATARSLCQQHEKLAGPSAAGFYLMGLLSDADHDTDNAIRLYRKAVYLEPGHVEALTHLAALLSTQGDHAGALRLQQRAQRAAEKSHA
ncbi:CheR family methyltransferase [uncultured Oxalicibacterium sp.]|uniref:CheR family methyltransferase n=1 Tax=uncultured Oxalicibacterium sp. TaxID=1168540 RepID=UPI0025E22ED8|nr:CheR family methyltransferase [uncultured Oxalicibacterium sp.]